MRKLNVDPEMRKTVVVGGAAGAVGVVAGGVSVGDTAYPFRHHGNTPEPVRG